MPFCPKCKTEYREGFKICADCKVELVDSLTEADAFNNDISENYEEAVEESDAFEEQKLNLFDILDEQTLETLNITPEKLEEWKENPPTPEELNQLKRFILKQRKLEAENEKFVSKKEKASDYLSSGISLVVIGTIGVVFIILAFCNVFPFIHLSGFGYVVYSIVGIIMAFLLYFGISSLLKVKSTKILAKSEEGELNEVKAFFDEEIVASKIDENLDISDDENLNYFIRSEKIKNIIKKKYPELKEGYIDDLIDEKYSDIFG